MQRKSSASLRLGGDSLVGLRSKTSLVFSKLQGLQLRLPTQRLLFGHVTQAHRKDTGELPESVGKAS